jgi:hypothetical protein
VRHRRLRQPCCLSPVEEGRHLLRFPFSSAGGCTPQSLIESEARDGYGVVLKGKVNEMTFPGIKTHGNGLTCSPFLRKLRNPEARKLPKDVARNGWHDRRRHGRNDGWRKRAQPPKSLNPQTASNQFHIAKAPLRSPWRTEKTDYVLLPISTVGAFHPKYCRFSRTKVWRFLQILGMCKTKRLRSLAVTSWNLILYKMLWL